MQTNKLAFFCALSTAVLVGCSGGGTSSGNDGGSDPADPTNPTATHSLELTLWDCPDPSAGTLDGCSRAESFDAQKPAIIQVEARREDRAAVGELVQVSTDKGSLIPTDGRVLTGSNGTALLRLLAGDAEGIATVIGTFADASDQILKEINAVDVALSLTTSLATGDALADGSTLAVTASLTVNNQPYLEPVAVSFSSTCASTGKALIDASVIANNGQAVATYKSDGCPQQDTITASLTLGTDVATDSTNITLASTPVATIEFLAATPDFIQLQGTGGTTSADISFKVVDQSGNPAQGQNVLFSLASGDNKVTLQQTSAISDNEGEVTATINAGNLPGSVRVQATVQGSDPVIASVSKDLSVGTGLPDKNSFSLSFSQLNPEAWHYDGVTVAVTVRAADHFSNPVPDGTAISFIAEGGAIEPRCTIQGGACSVSWTSQEFRPADGRVTVLAFAEGEESFVDMNGNGLFDTGEFMAQYDEREAFVDADEDGQYDQVEQLIDRNQNQAFDDVDGQYNGILCQGDAYLSGACSQDLVDVNASGVIVFSGAAPLAYFCHYDASDADNDNGGAAWFDCWDDTANRAWIANNFDDVGMAMACVVDMAIDGETMNPVPVGSSIVFSADDPLKTAGRTSHEKLSTNAPTYYRAADGGAMLDSRSSCGQGQYTVSVDTSDGFGILRVEVTTPKGIIASDSVAILEPVAAP